MFGYENQNSKMEKTDLLPLYIALLITALLVGTGCSTSDDERQFLPDLPQVTPSVITQFDSAGDIYFSHLGYRSYVTASGSVVIPEREHEILLEVEPTGELSRIVAQQGRGPGEIGDVISFEPVWSGSGGFVVFDQSNKRFVRFNESADYIDEQNLPQAPYGQVSEVFHLNDNRILTVNNSFDYIFNPEEEPKSGLAIYDPADERNVKSSSIRSKRYASLVSSDGVVRGGRIIYYGPEDLVAQDSQSENFFLYWTESDRVAMINTEFDTVSTIRLNLEAQRLSSAELDSIREDIGDDHWRTMRDELPEKKAVADRMMIDPQGLIWLKLNYASEYDQWLVADRDGEHRKIVNLPKESMLMHISDDHLGVRLDDVTFALFEAPEL